ncbi:MAG: TetR/AcrR family transcriptional regulator [Acidiferrobacteraceae bacterium]
MVADLPSPREQVLRTALRLFTEQGYFNTSVHDIARMAQVSIGSIYHHFKDKEGIAKALFEQLVTRMGAAFDAIEDAHKTAHDRCHAVVELLFTMTEEEPAVMAYMLHAQHQEFMPGELPVCSSRPFTQMRAMAAAGMDTGEMRRMDPLVAATCLFGGPIRMISLRLDGILKNPLPQYLDEVWSASWRSVTA